MFIYPPSSPGGLPPYAAWVIQISLPEKRAGTAVYFYVAFTKTKHGLQGKRDLGTSRRKLTLPRLSDWLTGGGLRLRARGSNGPCWRTTTKVTTDCRQTSTETATQTSEAGFPDPLPHRDVVMENETLQRSVGEVRGWLPPSIAL